MKLFVEFWKFTKICKDLQHRNTELFLFWFLDVQNNFMFPIRKNSQKQVKNQKSTDKHSSFDGLIQEDIDLSDIYLAVHVKFRFSKKTTKSCFDVYISTSRSNPSLSQMKFNQIPASYLIIYSTQIWLNILCYCADNF